jgi:hypothetical protein
MVHLLEGDFVDRYETPPEALATMPRAFLLAVSITAPSLMDVPFLSLQNGFFEFFPGEPIGGVPETRFARVGRAHQRWGKKEPTSSLVGIVLAIFVEQRYERSDGKHHEAKENDHFHVDCCSPTFDSVFLLALFSLYKRWLNRKIQGQSGFHTSM